MPDGRAPPQLVLASASPRRLALLEQAGLAPVRAERPEVDESPLPSEMPARLAGRLAKAKAKEVAARHPGAFILAADTVVACGRRVLPKAADEAQARVCLMRLSGRRHKVHTGIAVVDPEGRCRGRVVTSTVTFKRLSAGEVAAYLASGEWRNKAGGYAIQGRAALFNTAINGSYTNVVGLPLSETANLLAGLGYPVPGRS